MNLTLVAAVVLLGAWLVLVFHAHTRAERSTSSTPQARCCWRGACSWARPGFGP